MGDACMVVVLGAPVTGEDGAVTVPEALVYSGRCKVQTYEPHESSPNAGGAVMTVQRYALHVPVGLFVPAVGQKVTITGAALDPALVGREYKVVSLLHKSTATAYRLGIVEWVDG